MSRFKILTDDEIRAELETLPDWKVSEGKLEASFTFTDFRTAFAFIAMVALESEAKNHHPEWRNAYNKVSFAFSTHDAGDKITDLDIHMARYISQAAGTFQR